jgi:hypothetical protein
MREPTFWEFLTLDADDLVALGVPKRHVSDRRFAATGHVRPIGARWIKSFGAWGGVLGLDEIADKVGVECQVVIDYAKAKGLRYATRERHITHGQLALELWCDRGRDPAQSCKRFSVYPAERRLLASMAQVLVDTEPGGFDAVLRWSLRDLDAAFADLRVDFDGHERVRRPRKMLEAA